MSQTNLSAPPATVGPPVPGPRGYPLVGISTRMMADPLAFLSQATQRYGGLMRLDFGTRAAIFVTHPDLLRRVLLENVRNYGKDYASMTTLLGDGLVTSNGESWLQQRRLMQPSFHHKKIAALSTVMLEEAQAMVARWRPVAAAGQPLNIASEMLLLAQRIIVRTMFSIDVGPEADRIGHAFDMALNHTEGKQMSPLPIPESWPTPANRRFRKAITYLERTVYRMIAERRRSGEDRDDLLGMLIAAQDADTGERMSDRQIRDEVMTIYLAGHETTATVLGWTLYSLSHNPHVERLLRAEYAAVLGGRTPGFADVPSLPYSRMVIDEVLRLYPPTWFLSRGVVADDELGGYRIPAGSQVMLSPYVTQRLPEFWEHPEGFDPERFTPERSAGRHKFAYFPFLTGPRQCIGNTFALMEMQLALPIILGEFRLSAIPGYPAQPKARATLRPHPAIWMRPELI